MTYSNNTTHLDQSTVIAGCNDSSCSRMTSSVSPICANTIMKSLCLTSRETCIQKEAQYIMGYLGEHCKPGLDLSCCNLSAYWPISFRLWLLDHPPYQRASRSLFILLATCTQPGPQMVAAKGKHGLWVLLKENKWSSIGETGSICKVSVSGLVCFVSVAGYWQRCKEQARTGRFDIIMCLGILLHHRATNNQNRSLPG